MLEVVENDEVKTQVNIFSEHKEEDAEEFSHRYDNVRMEMEYPLTKEIYTYCIAVKIYYREPIFAMT